MKLHTLFWLLVLSFLAPTITLASYIPYCTGNFVSNEEDAVIQRLAPKFGDKMRCEVGDNCLLKWGEKGKSERFSITWKQPCGPATRPIKQSTFICQFSNKKSVCCWPLGYQKVNSLMMCSEKIIKR